MTCFNTLFVHSYMSKKTFFCTLRGLTVVVCSVSFLWVTLCSNCAIVTLYYCNYLLVIVVINCASIWKLPIIASQLQSSHFLMKQSCFQILFSVIVYRADKRNAPSIVIVLATRVGAVVTLDALITITIVAVSLRVMCSSRTSTLMSSPRPMNDSIERSA